MYCLSEQHKLTKADDFSSVFVFRKVRSGIFFKIYYRPTQASNTRLGLIVGKKVHKRANRRNYMKRVFRELFRVQQTAWSGYDIVVRVHKCFMATDFTQIEAEFTRLTKGFRLEKEIQSTPIG